MEIIEKFENKTVMRSNRGNVYEFTCVYPNENPPNAIEEITDCLNHLGIFNGIK